MPFKYVPPTPPPAPADESGSVGPGDYLRLAAATGLRVGGPYIGGLLGAGAAALGAPETLGGSAIAGPAITAAGAGLGGAAGEWAAEKIEPRYDKKRTSFFNKDTSLGRIAVGGLIGAVPGTLIVRAGKPLLSAGAGAALGYSGVAGNKIAEGEKVIDAVNPATWSKGDIIGGPGLGALTAGGLAYAHGSLSKGAPKTTPPPPPEPPLRGAPIQVRPGPEGQKVFTLPEGTTVNLKKGVQTASYERPTRYDPAANAAEAATPKTVKPPKQLTPIQKATIDNDTTQAAKSEFNERVAPAIKQATKNDIARATAAAADTRPSVTSIVRNPEEVTVPTREEAAAAQAAGVPEEPSELTQAALSKTGNTRMANAQRQLSKTQERNLTNAEQRADLQNVKTTEGGTDIPSINAAAEKQAAAREVAQDEAEQQAKIDTYLANPENKPSTGPVKIVTKGTSDIGEGQSQVTTVGPEDLEEAEEGAVREPGEDPHGQGFPNPKAAKAAVSDFGGSSRTHDISYDPATKQWVVSNKGIGKVNPFDGPTSAADALATRSPIAEAQALAAKEAPPAPPVAPEPPPAATPATVPPVVPKTPPVAGALPPGLEGVVKDDNPLGAVGQVTTDQTPPVAPKATFLGYTDPRMSPDGVSQPMYNIEGGPSDKSTVTGEAALAKLGAEKPPTPSFQEWSTNRVSNDAAAKVVNDTAKAEMAKPANKAKIAKLKSDFNAKAAAARAAIAQEANTAPPAPPPAEPTPASVQPTGTPQTPSGAIPAVKGQPPVEAPPQLTPRHRQLATLWANYNNQKGTPGQIAKITKQLSEDNLAEMLTARGQTIPSKAPAPAAPLGPPRLVKGATPPSAAPQAPAPTPAAQPNVPNVLQQLEDASQNYGAIKDAKAAGDQGFEPARTYYGQKAGGAAGRAVAADPTLQDIDASNLNPQAKEALLKSLVKKAQTELAKNPSGSIDPMILYRLGGGAVGAGVGAALDDKDRLRGAMLGGAAGAFGPEVVRGGANLAGKINTDAIVDRLPDIQRAFYLSSPNGLMANTVGAPLGLGATTAIEKMLQGVYSKDPEMIQQGGRLFKGLVKIPGKARAAFREASNIPRDSPLNTGESLPLARATNKFDKAISAPATGITAAHMALRDAGIEAGMSVEEATEMALGNEPGTGTGNQRLRALGQGWQNFKATPATDASGAVTATNLIGNMLTPFTRTASNVAAATPSRFPGVGFLAKAMGQNISGPELAAQQTMGLGVSAGAYELGKYVDPSTAKIVRKWVRNLGGRYGLIASAFFEAGQAAHEGKSAVAAAGKGFIEGAPMPSTEVPKDWYEAATAPFVEGKFKVPRSAIPALFQGNKEDTNPVGIVPYDKLTGSSGGFRYRPK
jgi:hypothetical protein